MIYTVASMVGANDPEAQVDGYLCGGGTEGNDHGLWLGRNKLHASVCSDGGKGKSIVVLSSCFSHYSIVKEFGRLFDSWRGGSDLLRELPPNQEGELAFPAVEHAIRECHQAGYRRFLCFLSAGTTNFGSVDRIEEICEGLDGLRAELGIETYVHVDAAFGGFVLPFIEPCCRFGFQNGNVDSVSIDAHKMGYVPYPGGIFICRKGYLQYTMTSAGYIYGHEDRTVGGSRSGAAAAACWTALNTLGRSGYQKKLAGCLAVRDYLCERLAEFNEDGRVRVSFYPRRLNIQAVWFSPDLAKAMDVRNPKHRGMSLRERFCIPTDVFPELTGLLPHATISPRVVPVFRFVVMPHLRRRHVDMFIKALHWQLARQRT